MRAEYVARENALESHEDPRSLQTRLFPVPQVPDASFRVSRLGNYV